MFESLGCNGSQMYLEKLSRKIASVRISGVWCPVTLYAMMLYRLRSPLVGLLEPMAIALDFEWVMRRPSEFLSVFGGFTMVHVT